MMIHVEAQYLQRYNIKYFSDLINIEEVWKRIDDVLLPFVPEIIEQPRMDVVLVTFWNIC